MKNLSRYQLLIKNEQQKVKSVVGICTNRCGSDNTVQDDLELIQNLYNRAGVNEINISGRCIEPINEGEIRLNRKRKQRNVTDTNVYKFRDQDLISNSLGNSNRLVERSRRSERNTIDKILRKYMRTDNF